MSGEFVWRGGSRVLISIGPTRHHSSVPRVCGADFTALGYTRTDLKVQGAREKVRCMARRNKGMHDDHSCSTDRKGEARCVPRLRCSSLSLLQRPAHRLRGVRVFCGWSPDRRPPDGPGIDGLRAWCVAGGAGRADLSSPTKVARAYWRWQATDWCGPTTPGSSGR